MRRSECADYTVPPPEPTRITRQEMAVALGYSTKWIQKLTASSKGMCYLMKALARKGIMLTYERKKNRTYFYKEEN